MIKSNTAALLLGVGAIAAGALVKKLWLEKYRKQKEELAAAGHEREVLYRLLKLKQAVLLAGEHAGLSISDPISTIWANA